MGDVAPAQTDDEISNQDRADRLDDLPPSAKLVFKVLEYDAPLTQQELSDQTRLPSRTTRHALSKLTDAGLVNKQISLSDARKYHYTPCSLPETAVSE